MICGICDEKDATELAILEGRTIAIHPECYEEQAKAYAEFPLVVARIER